MSMVATNRAWLRRMAAAAPSAWHYDPIFRWAAIGAGVALALFILRLADSPALHGSSPVPAASVPTSLGSSYGETGGSSLAPPASTAAPAAIVPKISPGRSLDGVAILPAPEHDRFGTVPPATHR
jgi:hypothetical protein